ncbi:GNAT family N-acetyltransferase [Bacillus haikouensis]|jgi:ribosomal protein S18 acetylase RimI-like enzyme|uniref:GNAT family N-acetyltransferase n=1 Tax=Bacillus haikouensis TaxID=1510468 RepID=UPI001554E80D|nr:GNAT family N-acetyltransferase [Bacillus haikouensis]NQD66366.1 GNAT family N-acetyltransferase [Bacillus haikouensis]
MHNFNLKNGQTYKVREYTEVDFERVHELNIEEEWNNLVKKEEDTRNAWGHSNVRFLVFDDDVLVGYVRGFTDGYVTTYISELLVNQHCRGQGVGRELIKFVHHLYPRTRIDLLASKTSKSFYEANDYRAFYGFRKTIEEYW